MFDKTPLHSCKALENALHSPYYHPFRVVHREGNEPWNRGNTHSKAPPYFYDAVGDDNKSYNLERRDFIGEILSITAVSQCSGHNRASTAIRWNRPVTLKTTLVLSTADFSNKLSCLHICSTGNENCSCSLLHCQQSRRSIPQISHSSAGLYYQVLSYNIALLPLLPLCSFILSDYVLRRSFANVFATSGIKALKEAGSVFFQWTANVLTTSFMFLQYCMFLHTRPSRTDKPCWNWSQCPSSLSQAFGTHHQTLPMAFGARYSNQRIWPDAVYLSHHTCVPQDCSRIISKSYTAKMLETMFCRSPCWRTDLPARIQWWDKHFKSLNAQYWTQALWWTAKELTACRSMRLDNIE